MYYLNGKYAEGLKIMNLKFDAHCSSCEAVSDNYFFVAKCHLKLQDNIAAIYALKFCLQKNPDHFEASLLFGNLMTELDEG